MKKITAINDAVQRAITIVAAKAKKTLQEPDYNVAMAVELPPLINASGIFPGVKTGGCFIHQSPKVTFTGKNGKLSSCELGDLLVICHAIVDGDDRYNAALVQWKIINSGVEKISGNALKQLDLYEHWPRFTLSSCGCQFDIYPKTVTPGAQYGLIQPVAPPSLFCTIPAITLKSADAPSFARFIINMMKWQTGRPYVPDEVHCQNDAWSRLILHLLITSLLKRFNRRNVRYEDWPRASKELLQLLVKDEVGDGGMKDTVEDKKSEDGGISILYIDMADGQGIESVVKE